MARLEGLIFDMDGTLFDSRTAIVPAVREALAHVAQDRGFPGPLPTDDEIGAHIGEASREFYVNVTPPALREHVDRIADLVRAGERRRIEGDETKLFPGVRETLTKLRASGLKLAYYSNSGPGYFYSVLRAHRILDLAVAATCHGDEKATKVQMVAALKYKMGTARLGVVGDRGHDLDAAKANDAASIGALYGFGSREELSGADLLLERFTDLPVLLAGTLT